VSNAAMIDHDDGDELAGKLLDLQRMINSP
jgi:hypothetical protein